MRLENLDGESWTRKTARAGFPILVEYVRQRREITYSEWDQQIVDRYLGHHVLAVQYGRPAGVIGDACIAYGEANGLEIPIINLMVVNAASRLPGTGADDYIEFFCRSVLRRRIKPSTLTPDKKRAIIDQAQKAIFDFQDWEKVLKTFGLERLHSHVLSRQKKVGLVPNGYNWHQGPESEAHRSLKLRVASNPSLVGLPTSPPGDTEHRIWSGDRLDVLFEDISFGVEVKTSTASADELHRGIYQCIKYREVMKAQQIQGRKIPTADCVLAIGGKLSKELEALASLLKIKVFDNLDEG